MRYPLYLCERNDEWRYVLGTSGTNPLYVVGLNPHQATQNSSDRTVEFAQWVAQKSGHDSFVMLNLYPVRSREVAVLPVEAEPTAVEMNKVAMLCVLGRHEKPHVLLAWGDDMNKRSYMADTARHLILKAQPSTVWYRFGDTTKLGHPRHLSRAAKRWNLEAFDAKAYVKLLDA